MKIENILLNTDEILFNNDNISFVKDNLGYKLFINNNNYIINFINSIKEKINLYGSSRYNNYIDIFYYSINSCICFQDEDFNNFINKFKYKEFTVFVLILCDIKTFEIALKLAKENKLTEKKLNAVVNMIKACE